VEVENLAVIAFDGDSRMPLALVLDDHQLAACAFLSSSTRTVSPSSMSS